ncbi:ABC transporter permease [Spirosoma sp. KUDC1026]|uniref:ABC transporter permease n=1 Tax=Spirosoma sp. KUDC1026 TaxID=2745947 RepID=UPI001C3F75A1|nr:ABC transporter permease [Spirosoma sp. KUDC1026]
MIKNYLKIAWRNLLHNKVFSLINLLGLSIGIASCLLIFLFIMNEYSVDQFHRNRASIYRVMRNFNEEGKAVSVAYLSGPYGPALLNDFKGQISRAVRVRQTNALVTSQNRSFYERKVIDADPDFFRLSSFPLLKGDPATALTNPGSVVLTESTARKYFGSVDNAVGQLIKLDKNLPLNVTGIAQDVPTNSHLSFDLVVPLANYRAESYMTQWVNNNVFTYVQLAPSASLAQIERSLPGFMQKYMGPVMKQFGFRFSLSLTPLRDIYFEQGAFDGLKHGDKNVVYLFLSIAALILLVACINFMNLSTVRAMERSREIGVRKVLGAVKQHLVWQFIGESVLLTTLSCGLAVGLVALTLPAYAQLLGQPIQLTAYALPITLFLIGIIVVTGFLAAIRPLYWRLSRPYRR